MRLVNKFHKDLHQRRGGQFYSNLWRAVNRIPVQLLYKLTQNIRELQCYNTR